MELKDLQLEVTDQDHIWVNGRQFISLRRFHEAVSEAKKICGKYDADVVGALVCKYEPKAPVEKDNMYCCPRCDSRIVNASVCNMFSYKEWSSKNYNYCMKCGQHLDWLSICAEDENDLS